MADFEKMVKNETDWHLKYNSNLDVAQTKIDASEAAAQEGMVPRPSSTAEGILYQETDGSTSVIKTFPTEQYVYGVVIDLNDPNPAAVTYTDDARGFIPAYGSNMGSWERTKLYRDIKPCVMNVSTGVVAYYIQKDNFNLKEEGVNIASVLTGADGQVMIEFPKLFWDISIQGQYMYVRIGNYKFSTTAVCYAHTDGIYERDTIYSAAYKGTSTAIATSTLNSVSGAAPIVSQTIATFRAAARRQGNRCHINPFFGKMMTSILALLLYKNRDLQSSLAEGWCRTTAYGQTTGNLNARPFCWGAIEGAAAAADRGKTQMKFLGMEDWYGGIWEFVDGIVMTNYVYKATTDTSLFSDTGVNYEKVLASGLVDTTNNGTYMKYVKGTNEFPFLVDGSKPDQGMLGSETTHWSDGAWFNNTTTGYTTTICLFGGAWAHAGRVGAFYWYLDNVASVVASSIGSRLWRI